MADPISATVTAIAVAAANTAAAVAAAVGASFAVQGAIAAAVFKVTPYVLMAAASAAASFLLAPKLDIEGRPTDWRADPNAGIPFVMGERATAGVIVHRDAWGKDNRFQSFVTVYSGAGPIESFDQFYADDVAVQFNLDGLATNGGNFAQNMHLQTARGDQPQTAALVQEVDAAQLAGNPMSNWGASYRISGKAHALLTLRQDSKQKTYPTGEPRPLFKMRGIKLYDPRKDSTVAGGSGSHRLADPSTYEYSENPSIAAVNWVLGLRENGVVVGGLGAPVEGVDLPAFIEWANVCDQNGWTVSANATSADDKHQVLLGLMQAGGARYSRSKGRISVIARAPKTSVVTLSAEDTAGPFELATAADRLTATNTVVPRCVMESHQWEMVAQDAVTVAAYVTADGGRRERGLDFPYVAVKASGANKDQPAQLAAYAIADSRETIAGAVALKPWGAQIEPGDVFTINAPGLLLNGVECLCVGRAFDLAENVVRISFISETEGKHDFALGRTQTAPTPPALSAPDLTDVDPPDGGDYTVDVPPSKNPGFRVRIDPPSTPNPGQIIYIRPPNDDLGNPWEDPQAGWRPVAQLDAAATEYQIGGLEPATAYEIGAGYVSQFGVLSPVANLGEVTTGALDATQLGDRTAAEVNTDLDAVRAELDSAAAALDSSAADLTEALAGAKTDLSEGRDRSNRLFAEVAAQLVEIKSGAGAAADADLLRQTEITALTVRADGIEATATQALSATVDLENDKAEASALTALEALVGTDDGQGALFSRAATLEGQVVSLEADKAEASDLSALETLVGSDDGGGALFGRVATAESSISDLETGKAEASALTTLEARVTTVEGEADANASNITTTIASVEALDQATAEADRAQADRLTRALAEIAAGQAFAVQGVSVVADDLKIEAKRVSDLGVRTGAAEANISTLETTKADASDLTAEAARIDTLEAQVGTDDSAGALFARVAANESAVADLDSTKAEASALTTLEARVTVNEGEIDTAQSDIQTNAALIQTLETATAEADRAQADRLTRALAEIAAGAAQSVQGVSVVADGLKIEAKRIADLSAEADGLEARVTTAESTLVDLENDKAEASALTALTARVDTAEADITTNASAISNESSARASADTTLQANIDGVSANVSTNASAIADIEGNLAAAYGVTLNVDGKISGLQFLNDGTTSSLSFLADVFTIFDGSSDVAPFTVSGGVVRMPTVEVGTVRAQAGDFKIIGSSEDIVPFSVSGNLVFFASPIHIDDGDATPTTRTIIGPLADGMSLWSGPPTITEDTATRANARFAIGEYGAQYPTQTTATGGVGYDVTGYSGTNYLVLARLALSDIQAINALAFSKTALALKSPPGNLAGSGVGFGYFDVRLDFMPSTFATSPGSQHTFLATDIPLVEERIQINRDSDDLWSTELQEFEAAVDRLGLVSTRFPDGYVVLSARRQSASPNAVTAKFDSGSRIAVTPVVNQTATF
ncbi:MAG: hypothetical protein ABL308_12655 [Oceanicaulis sp.]